MSPISPMGPISLIIDHLNHKSKLPPHPWLSKNVRKTFLPGHRVSKIDRIY